MIKNIKIVFVIIVSIFLTVFLTTIVSYQLFQKEVFSDLSSFAEILEELDMMEQMKEGKFVNPDNELRITWISEHGSVLYDSYTDESILNNHGDRPEILQAVREGEGSCVRRSQTMEESIFFYARKKEDGSVIRIAKEAGSIWKVYGRTLPVTLLTAVLLTGVFMFLFERIRSQHQEALRNAKLRQEFAANVSHELKTPLTSISGYAELIANGMASKKEGRHFAGEIYANAQRLLTLINDILRLSELDDPSGQSLSFETVDVYEVAVQCMDMMGPVAKRHHVSLSLKGSPLYIRADRGLLEELLYNLCDNAVRYNKKGGHVWITVTDQLIVRDDGIGIPKKHQKSVFQRFYRVDKSRSKKTGGTGLGLAIVKHIAEVHNAVITLESDEGMGTVICVKFPNVTVGSPVG